MHSVLVICVGNICRSPIAERLLRRDVLGLRVSSAGLSAVVGHGIQPEMAAIAAETGLDATGHRARQFTTAMGMDHDLILVMEPSHRDEITRIAPHLRGRCMLLDHWSGGKGIDDPYRRGQAAYAYAFQTVTVASQAWAARLIS
jgi:protein-tyrosine phosphatase